MPINKRTLINCFLLILLTWILLFLLFVAFFSQGHTDMNPTCEQTMSQESDEDVNIINSNSTYILPKLIKKLKKFDNVSAESEIQVSKARREIERGVNELWFYLKSEFKKLKNEKNVTKFDDVIKGIMDLAGQQTNAILNNVQVITDVKSDQSVEEYERLSQFVQNELLMLQHPKNCLGKKLICDFRFDCGLACTVHHLVYCLMMGYGTKRTLLLDDSNNNLKHEWKSLFKPTSSCKLLNNQTFLYWNDFPHSNFPILKLPILAQLLHRPHFLPLSIPNKLYPHLSHLHGDPFVWWAGQLLKFILRPKRKLQLIIQKMKKRIKFQHPIVGIHVRRTDKIGREASFHSLDEYMEHVEEYYSRLEMKGEKFRKSVYLASDDPTVLSEANKRYPEYLFISDTKISKSAKPDKRNTEESMLGIILDIHFLSHCDFIVCTFSSQVCRAAYELMQTIRIDSASSYRSLDDIYYFAGQFDPYFETILPHQANNKDEVDLRVGDLVHVLGNHWNGYSKGIVTRTKQVGLFPSFKIRHVVKYVQI